MKKLLTVLIMTLVGPTAMASPVPGGLLGVPDDNRLPTYVNTTVCGEDSALGRLDAESKVKFIAREEGLYLAGSGDYMNDGTLAILYFFPVVNKTEQNLGEGETIMVGQFRNSDKSEYSYLETESDGEVVISLDYNITRSKVIMRSLSNNVSGTIKTCVFTAIR